MFKTRVAGVMLLLVSCLVVAGCGSDGNSAALGTAAAQQQAQIANTNKLIITSSGGVGFGTWGIVAGTTQVKSTFSSYSGAFGKLPETKDADFRYSVDAQCRLTKQKKVFGTMSSSTAYTYDGTTTTVTSTRFTGAPPFIISLGIIFPPSSYITECVYTYDDSGRITGYIKTVTPTGAGTVSVTTTIIAYDDKGRTETTTDSATPPNILATSVYNTHGDLVSSTVGTTVTSHELTYDAFGNLTDDKQFVQAGAGVEVLQSEIISTYGVAGVLTVKIITYGLDGITVTSSIVMTFAYDGSGNLTPASMATLDATGETTAIRYIRQTYVTLQSGIDDQ